MDRLVEQKIAARDAELLAVVEEMMKEVIEDSVLYQAEKVAVHKYLRDLKTRMAAKSEG